jgi:hypothetical protein
MFPYAALDVPTEVAFSARVPRLVSRGVIRAGVGGVVLS